MHPSLPPLAMASQTAAEEKLKAAKEHEDPLSASMEAVDIFAEYDTAKRGDGEVHVPVAKAPGGLFNFAKSAAPAAPADDMANMLDFD